MAFFCFGVDEGGVPLGLLLRLRWWFRWLLTGTFDRVDGRVGKTNGIERSWNRWGPRFLEEGDVRVRWIFFLEFFLGGWKRPWGNDFYLFFWQDFVGMVEFFFGGFNGGGKHITAIWMASKNQKKTQICINMRLWNLFSFFGHGGV